MTREAHIVITFTDWWLSGTGRAGSDDVDAVVHCDRFGCPALPMTQVKGQLRESADRLAEAGAGGWTKELLGTLFGRAAHDRAALAFRGDATLDPATARWFALHPAARDQLKRRRAATRIDEFGVAYDDTLRWVEAAVPLELTGSVVWAGDGGPPPGLDWAGLLDQACAATLAFGKLKTDGYGRAIASCRPVRSGGSR
jgi:hypothetical protein